MYLTVFRSANLNFTNSGERHLAYERIAEKLRQHGASFEQTHRLNEKFLKVSIPDKQPYLKDCFKLKWRYMKEYHLVEDGKRAPTWPYYQSLSFLLPSVLELERWLLLLPSCFIPSLLFRKRMNASVPEDNHSRDEQYVDVQDVIPSTSNSKSRGVCFSSFNSPSSHFISVTKTKSHYVRGNGQPIDGEKTRHKHSL